MADKVIWEPQAGPQTDLIRCPVFEVFYGGARGGGKTEGSIGDWLEHANTYGEAAVGIFVRRTAKQLEEVIARTKKVYGPLGWRWREQKSEWTSPRGARLKFRYLERDADAEEYQGHSYTRVYVEEATNFPSPSPINMLRATVRSPEGVPAGLRLTGNPGGPGHSWVKERYIKPNPKGYEVLSEKFKNPFTGEVQEIERVFIPSRISDNIKLMKNDPMYVARLQQQGSESLVRAWLMGDWDAVLGAFFSEWDQEKHILPHSEWFYRIPPYATRFRALDWGSAKPFSVGWYAVSDGAWGLPRGALFKYREWYGVKYKTQEGEPVLCPDEGLKLYSTQVARGILVRDQKETIDYGVADPSIFIRQGGPSIGEEMMIENCMFHHADNKRQPGWDQMRAYLSGNNGVPMLYFSSTCEHTIRTLPLLQHDEKRPEDVDTKAEDHAADETRYAVMSRPPIQDAPAAVPDTTFFNPATLTFEELVRLNKRKRLAREDSV